MCSHTSDSVLHYRREREAKITRPAMKGEQRCSRSSRSSRKQKTTQKKPRLKKHRLQIELLINGTAEMIGLDLKMSAAGRAGAGLTTWRILFSVSNTVQSCGRGRSEGISAACLAR